jgi:hypothetical protein
LAAGDARSGRSAIVVDRCRAALVFFRERAYSLNQYVRELASETTKEFRAAAGVAAS